MDKTFNVSFVCDYMVVLVSVDVDPELSDGEIARIASQYTLDNYGISPLDLCFDYEINEV